MHSHVQSLVSQNFDSVDKTRNQTRYLSTDLLQVLALKAEYVAEIFWSMIKCTLLFRVYPLGSLPQPSWHVSGNPLQQHLLMYFYRYRSD